MEGDGRLAIAVSATAGLAYGLLHAALMNAPYNDPGQGSPSLAALGSFMLGIIIGPFVVVLVTAVVTSLGRRSITSGGLSWPWLAGLFVAMWFGACTITAPR